MARVDNVSGSVSGPRQPRNVGDSEQRKSAGNPKKRDYPKKIKSKRKAKSSSALSQRDEVPRNVAVGNASLKENLQSMLMAAATSLSRMNAQKENKNVEVSATNHPTTSATRLWPAKIWKLSETILRAQQVEENIINEVKTPEVPQLKRAQKSKAGKRFKGGRHENVLRLQDLEGYRGEDDIEKILEFIESNDDKKESPETPKKKNRSKNKTKKQLLTNSNAMKSSDDYGSYRPPDLHVLAEKSGFTLNVQYGKVGGGSGCGGKSGVHVRMNTPEQTRQKEDEDRVIVEGTTESGTCFKLVLLGFTFPPEDHAISQVECQNAIDSMKKRAAELKRLAHAGIITSKFI